MLNGDNDEVTVDTTLATSYGISVSETPGLNSTREILLSGEGTVQQYQEVGTLRIVPVNQYIITLKL